MLMILMYDTYIDENFEVENFVWECNTTVFHAPVPSSVLAFLCVVCALQLKKLSDYTTFKEFFSWNSSGN